MAALGASAAASVAVQAVHAAVRPARRGRLALLLLAVLALHGWLLGEFSAARPRPAGAPAALANRPADRAARATTVRLRAAPAAGDAAAVSTAASVAASLGAPGSAARPVDGKVAAGAASAAQLRRASAHPARQPVQADTPSAPTEPAALTAPATTTTTHATLAPVADGPHADAAGGNRPAPDSTLPTLTALAVAAPRRPSTAPSSPSQPPPSPPPAGTTPLPHTPPPSAELTYAVHRGPVAGKGRLVWRISPASASAPASYSLSLEARLPVLGVIFSETSSGGFDAHGLAPTRHTERRLRRSERALSITRNSGTSSNGGNGSGTLSFSASTARLALLPGTQDRVSWLVQLAAVYGAATLPAAGAGAATARPVGLPAGLNLPVASVNGDLRLWQFRLLPATPEAPGLLHLERRPAPGDFDTAAEVWLDPARHAWPVRVLLTEASGETMELRLERLSE